VPAVPAELAFYSSLAPWWPLVSPPEEYVEEAAFATRLLQSGEPPVHAVLELGSGGGHNALHMKSRFAMTLVDRSDAMLELSRRLNPECDHVCGDMRSVRLEQRFDAVFIHDAIDYMITEADLRAALETAFVHCRPGGVAVIIPDHTRENFEAGSDSGGSDAPDGRGIRYLEWTFPVTGEATSVRTEYVFAIRGAGDVVEVVHETHTTGLFAESDWLRLLDEVGFLPERIVEDTTEDRTPRTVFLGRCPR
jgi:trans-aconitate methyltransferase